jgi:hypothetical protein
MAIFFWARAVLFFITASVPRWRIMVRWGRPRDARPVPRAGQYLFGVSLLVIGYALFVSLHDPIGPYLMAAEAALLLLLLVIYLADKRREKRSRAIHSVTDSSR